MSMPARRMLRHMKFCDGQRTLEPVVTNMLNHQSHQLDTLKAAAA
jgi:hypothetical protein